jgi:Mg/Co/Ni transporter MgtE
VLDKKVIDLEGRDVDVVYDIKMILRNDKLYVTKVDFSWHGLLRRMGLRWLSDFIYDMSAKSKKETISWSYIEPLPQQIGSFKGNVQLKVIKERLADIPPADLADILEELDHEQRIAIFSQLDQEHASDILEEIEPSVQRALVSSLGISKTAKLVREMTTGQAADLLSALPHNEAASIMELLDPEEVKRIQAIMNRQEEQILDYATQDIIILPPDETADRVQETFPKLAKGKDVIMYIYVADSKNKLLGVLDLKELLKADDNSKLEDIMTESVVALNPDSTLHEAYDYFMRYGFRAIPIVDTPGRILGAIPYRDVMNLKHRFWE